MPDFLPRPDGTFDSWTQNYVGFFDNSGPIFGVTEAQVVALLEAREQWNAAYASHVAAQRAAEAARQDKEAARRAMEQAIRPSARVVQTFPATTDGNRARLGLNVPDLSRTASPTPTTAPLLSVAPAARLTHQLRLVDESTPTRRRKPDGVAGAEVWLKLVAAAEPAPTNPAALVFLTRTTRPTFRTDFKPGEGGKTAVYMARWISTRGEKGPWSEITTATVAA